MVKLFPEGLDYYSRTSFDIKGNRTPLLIIRLLGFIGQTFLFSQSILSHNPIYKAVFFFTSWGIILSWVCFGFLLCATLYPNPKRTQFLLYKATYVLYETAWTSQVVITIFFWTVLTPMNPKWLHSGRIHRILMVTMNHAFAIIIFLADTLINRMEFYLPHILFPGCIALGYTILGITLSYNIGFVAYPVLTWKDWISLVSAFGIIVLFTGSFIGGYYIGKLKRELFGRDETNGNALLSTKFITEQYY
eukprot:TRINITY_DN895_c0_g1_i1.p1 TRINITY_DN895_c0_g1~~TRINITY_DN895_c0_g1_i1.p1  ORF type:complete len:248 (+),score=5.68 TRINITY_DN895_c0_g1_i1:473-1216(+)